MHFLFPNLKAPALSLPLFLIVAVMWRLTDGSCRSTTIGRSSKLVHVVLDVTPNKSISRKHAEVVLRTDGGGHTTFILRDLVIASNLPCIAFASAETELCLR